MRPARLSLTMLAAVLLLSPVASRQLTAVRVARGQDLQAALDAAKPGDVVLLEAGARFTGNFRLRARPGAQAFITVRTDAAGLPGEGMRTSPSSSGTLAVLQSPNNLPALRTEAGAHHWRIENVEFAANRRGDGDIIALGDPKAASAESLPSDLVLDRVYVHGDPHWGQKRGIALNSASTRIVNSYIADIKALGADAQAIGGWAGPGPYTIENNYLEASGEVIMFGGGDPAIPDLVPEKISIRRNTITRPAAWRDPVVSAPAGVTARLDDGGGTLPAGTYTYRVVAEQPTNGGAVALSRPSEPATITVGENGAVAIEWRGSGDAQGYRVYRVDGPGAGVYWRTEMPRFVDAGTNALKGTPPKTASVWSVKNLLELKNARDVQIDGNLFENHWAGGQPGYAIVFTPRNQGGGAAWCTVERVTFSNNIVRHVSSVFNILGSDDLHPSGRTRDITIVNNLFTDVSGAKWGGPGDFLQIGDGPLNVHVERNTIDQTGRIVSIYAGKSGARPEGFVFRNNVVRQNAYGVIGSGAAPGKDTFQKFIPEAVFTGNVIAGGDQARYPSGNRVVSDSEFAAQTRGSSGEPTAGADREALKAALGPVAIE